ncbi:MAG: DUF1565 domain-containing protein [Myxococcota bacterium]
MRALTGFALVLLVACGGSVVVETDAGIADAGVPDAGAGSPEIPWLAEGEPPIAPPDLPWLDGDANLFGTCPEGWAESVEEGVRACSAYAVDGPRSCPRGWAHFPGTEGCAPLGRDCGDGPFATTGGLRDPLLFVDLTGPVSADGSRERPFRTLGEALSVAEPGTTILLASGGYELRRPWPGGVGLRGRCAAMSALTGERRGLAEAALDIEGGGPDTLIEDVAIQDPDLRAVWVRPRTERLTLRALDVRGAGGLLVEGASAAQGERLALASTSAEPALTVVDGTFDAAEVVVNEAASEAGVLVEGDGVCTLSGAHLAAGDIALATVFGTLRVQESWLEGDAPLALDVAGGRATLRQVRVRGPGRDGALGGTIVVSDGTLEVDGMIQEGAGVLGIDAIASELALEDVVLRGTGAAADGGGGQGLIVSQRSTLRVERALLEGHRTHAAIVTGGRIDATPPTAFFEDVVVRDMRPALDTGQAGFGLLFELGARGNLERVLLQRNLEVGLQLANELEDVLGVAVPALPTRVVATDIAIEDTLPSADSGGVSGFGIAVDFGEAVLELSRARIVRSRRGGVFVADRARAELEDVVIRETRREEASLASGFGLAVFEGASVSGERVLVADNESAGVIVAADARAELRNAVVRETSGPACLPDCTDEPPGVSFATYDGALVSVERFVFEDAVGCGLQVGGAELTLRSGLVQRHAIGACLQDDLPVSRLQDGVRYVDNEVLLERTSFPLPQILEP